jgi:hypothetical protein
VSERPEQASEDAALYVNERELHRRINPMLAFDRFRAVVREAELRSFPKISASWGGRYWPAVKVWLDAENGIGANDHAVTDAQDGPETFHASTRQGPGLKRGRHNLPYWIATQVARDTMDFPDRCIPLPPDADEAMLSDFCQAHTARLNAWIDARKGGDPEEPRIDHPL